jgi:hypothetical protein
LRSFLKRGGVSFWSGGGGGLFDGEVAEAAREVGEEGLDVKVAGDCEGALRHQVNGDKLV